MIANTYHHHYFYNEIPVDSLPYYSSEVELAQIIIEPKISKESKLAAHEKIVELRRRIVEDGDKFNTLALIYSDDKGSAVKGGELGYFGRGMMVPEFEGAAFKLKPDSISKVIETKYGYHIIDLVKTSKFLKLAGKLLKKKAKKGEKFLFVGTNKFSASIVASEAKRANSFYINYRWLGGMLTNWKTIQKRIERLKYLEQLETNGNFENLSKKDYSSQKKEFAKLKKLFNGIKEMKTLPDLVIFTNQFKDRLAIQECLKLGIPAICIVDTNCDPDLIPYPIPANDDSYSSIKFILNYLTNRILAGYNNPA
jgi:small subunit ribosomal protein S2